eukprot:3551279-Prymnesium_polylepis.1
MDRPACDGSRLGPLQNWGRNVPANRARTCRCARRGCAAGPYCRQSPAARAWTTCDRPCSAAGGAGHVLQQSWW